MESSILNCHLMPYKILPLDFEVLPKNKKGNNRSRVLSLFKNNETRCYYCGNAGIGIVISKMRNPQTKNQRKRKFYSIITADFQVLTRDHFIPKSKGGVGSDNLVPACETCNAKKADMPGSVFLNIVKGIEDDWTYD